MVSSSSEISLPCLFPLFPTFSALSNFLALLFCRTLAAAFPDAGLGVAVANDGVLYETDVLAASNSSPYMFRHSRIATSSPNHRRHRSMQTQSLLSIWGQRPVLVLVGVRLGLDRFNPIYFDAVKVISSFDLCLLKIIV